MKFEKWFAATLGQSPNEVKKLLEDPTAVHFLITWSIFESRCFDGYFKLQKLDQYSKELQKEGYSTSETQKALLHFHQRYKDPKKRENLQHGFLNSEFEKLALKDHDCLSPQEQAYFIVFVVFRFRNNIFHGNKGVMSWLRYIEQIEYCTEVMQFLISHAERINCRLHS